jgi:hypothetical protein
MARNPFTLMVVSDQAPSLIDVTVGFRLQSAALDLGTMVMVTMSTEEHGAQHALEREKKGADPFPADVSVRRHLEHAAALALTDERIAVPETLGSGNVTAEEAEHMFGIILPHDFAALHVHFNDAGPGHDGVVSSIVENQHVPLWSEGGIMLVTDLPSSPFPQDFPFRPGDAHYRAEFAKTEQHVSMGACLNGIGVTPFMPEFSAADNVRFRIEVLPGMPRVHGIPPRVDLHNGVPQETAQVPGPSADSEAFHEEAEVLFVFRDRCCRFFAYEPLDTVGKFWGHLLPGDHKGVSVGKAAHVVMKSRMLPSPDFVSVPVEFNQDVGAAARGSDAGSGLIQGLAPDEEVPSGEEIPVTGTERGEEPAMDHLAGII